MRGDTIESCSSPIGFRLSSLLQQFVWVALFQTRPQDLPPGQIPMRIAIIINVVTYTVAVASNRSIPNSLALALTDLAISGLCLYMAVSVVDKRARFHQAFTALCGGTAVLNVAAMPVLWLSATTDPPSFSLLNLLIVFWGLAIIAHVLRHTLEVAPYISVGLALVFYLFVVQLLAITGVLGSEPQADQQLSTYQSLSVDWLSKG